MNGKVLIPLDGSTRAAKALPIGLNLARRLDGEVLLVRVVPLAWRVMPRFEDTEEPTMRERLATEANAYLEQIAGQLPDQDTRVESLVLEGQPGETIAEVAETRDVDYIVMGTHGHTGAFHWPLGSVASRVLQLATCPLILLPVSEKGHISGLSPAFRRILVPLDGSSEAEQILPLVRKLARLYGAELRLFRAYWMQPAFLPGAEIYAMEYDWSEQLREEVGSYLSTLASELELEGIRTQWSVVAEPAADAILDYANKADVDLIAMTSHARQGLSRMVLGSVTDRVARAGKWPVLVTRLMKGSA